MLSWIIFAVIGAIIGTLAGIFGIGGGIVTVPIIFLYLEQLGLDKNIAIQMAIKTSLAIIVFTSLLSIYTHNKVTTISWDIIRQLFPSIIVGTILGTLLLKQTPVHFIEILFASYVLLVAIKMWLGFSNQPTDEKKPPFFLNSLVGLIIGTKSGLLGIGGGTITIPYLSWQGVPIHKSVGISAAVSFLIAFSGTLTGLAQSEVMTDFSSGRLGLIYLPALFGVLSTSLIFARIGAKLSYKLPQRGLRKGFSVFLFIIALKAFHSLLT